jgi:hypothetical protein
VSSQSRSFSATYENLRRLEKTPDEFALSILLKGSCRMKFGIRRPSLRKRIAARTSWKRAVRQNLGIKAPRGYGWLTNPKKAAYNRVYSRTTIGLGKGCLVVFGAAAILVASAVGLLLRVFM